MKLTCHRMKKKVVKPSQILFEPTTYERMLGYAEDKTVKQIVDEFPEMNINAGFLSNPDKLNITDEDKKIVRELIQSKGKKKRKKKKR